MRVYHVYFHVLRRRHVTYDTHFTFRVTCHVMSKFSSDVTLRHVRCHVASHVKATSHVTSGFASHHVASRIICHVTARHVTSLLTSRLTSRQFPFAFCRRRPADVFSDGAAASDGHHHHRKRPGASHVQSRCSRSKEGGRKPQNYARWGQVTCTTQFAPAFVTTDLFRLN